MDYSGGTCWTC